MGKQKQALEDQVNHMRNKVKTEDEVTNLVELTSKHVSFLKHNHVELPDYEQLSQIQRHILANQMSKVHGNQHLQKIITTSRQEIRGETCEVLQWQRQINYLERVTGTRAEPYLTAFDQSVEQIEQVVSTVTVEEADDLREALAHLRSRRTEGRVTCWHISGGLFYASYDNATGELRLHINFGGEATSQKTLIHEALHVSMLLAILV